MKPNLGSYRPRCPGSGAEVVSIARVPVPCDFCDAKRKPVVGRRLSNGGTRSPLYFRFPWHTEVLKNG
jgi:hypothetical protein